MKHLFAAISLLSIAAAGQTLPNAVPMPSSAVQFVDANGLPLAGGKLYTCMAGLSCPGNPQATYTDSTASVQNANPIILDSAGRAQIWIGSQAYRLVLQDANGVQQWTQDNVEDTTLYFVNYVKTAGTATLITYTAPGPDTVQQTVAQKLANVISVMDYGAKCDATTSDGTTGTDDLAVIQKALDDNPMATIQFPNGAICKLSGTLILSSQSPLRNFGGTLSGNGVTLVWTNDGTIASTDANMPHGIGAYNRINDPANSASEIGGVSAVRISGFHFVCPNYGACIFLGNSDHSIISNNRFSGKSLTFNTVSNPRHGVVIDCGINDSVQNNFFDSFTIGMVSIIKSLDTATGHVVYTNFPPYSGYFNDSPLVLDNSFNGSAAFAILDMGTGSFTNRDIRNNIAGGGPKAWFYAAGPASALIKNNWCETCTYGVGVIANTVSGNIPGTGTSAGGIAVPHSYFLTPPGSPEHFILDNDEWANITGVFYSESQDSAWEQITNNRLNNVTAGVTFWVYASSTANTLEFTDTNLVIYMAYNYSALSRVVNPSVVAIRKASSPSYALNTVYPSGRNRSACQLYTVSITAGGHFFINGVDSGTAPLAQTFQYIYFLDSMPANSIITGIHLKTTTAFAATGLTSMTLTIGDGVGLGTPPATPAWFTSATYDLMAAVSNTNHAEYPVFRAPQDITIGHMFANFVANQNLSANPLTGAVNIEVCWAVMQ